MNMLIRAVYHGFYPLDVGLPHTVRAAVGVRNRDAEADAFIANTAFGHWGHILSSLVTGTL
jgi:hypothetical protein